MRPPLSYGRTQRLDHLRVGLCSFWCWRLAVVLHDVRKLRRPERQVHDKEWRYRTHTRTHVHTYTRTYTHIYTHIHTYTNTHMHTYTHRTSHAAGQTRVVDNGATFVFYPGY